MLVIATTAFSACCCSNTGLTYLLTLVAELEDELYLAIFQPIQYALQYYQKLDQYLFFLHILTLLLMRLIHPYTHAGVLYSL